MTKAVITKEIVFKAAKQLTEQGIFPTQTKVRELLGHGSMRDIGFYLREWKTRCFTENQTAPLLQEELTSVTLEIDHLETEKKQSEKTKLQLQRQLTNLTTELDTIRNSADRWQYQAEVLQTELTAKTEEIKQLTEQYHKCQELLKEREHSIEMIFNDKNQLIDSLRKEMKETYHQSIVEAREYNHTHHDELIKLQVENINLQEEIKTLNEKTKEQEEQLLSLKLNTASIKKELREKEAIINSCVTPEQLENYGRN